MPFPYRRALIIGASSGIGEALATRLVQEGSKVIVTGRRKENLAGFVHENGKENATAVPFDITETEKIPNFVNNVIQTYTDLDCIIMNSGIQRSFDFSKPDTVDLNLIQTEFNTNYLSYLALTKAFLPFLQSKQSESAIIYVSSSLALVPMVRAPNYCASKAALHHFVLSLREQLSSSQIKIIELFPPAVQTELHDEKHQPDIKNGRSIGMPLDQFTDEAYRGFAEGKEEVLVGSAQEWYDLFEPKRQEIFQQMIRQ